MFKVSYVKNNWKRTLKRFKDKDKALAYAKAKCQKYRDINKKGVIVVSAISLKSGKVRSAIYDVYRCERVALC